MTRALGRDVMRKPSRRDLKENAERLDRWVQDHPYDRLRCEKARKIAANCRAHAESLETEE